MNTLKKLNLQNNRAFNLNKFQRKFLNKSFRPTLYNLRLYSSNMKRNENSYSRWDMVYGPDGFDKTRTDRNPDNFKYRNNLWHHTIYELRHIYGDALYQIFLRRHRLSDPFGKYVLPSGLLSLFMLSGQHLFFFVRIIIFYCIKVFLYVFCCCKCC